MGEHSAETKRIEAITEKQRENGQDVWIGPMMRPIEAVADSRATCGALGCREEDDVSLLFNDGGRSRVLCARHAQDYLGEGKA